MSAKIKTIKKGLIDPSSFSIKRRINVDKQKLEEWVKDALIKKTEEKVSVAPSVKKNKDGVLKNISEEKNIKTVKGRIEFPTEYEYPEFIRNLVRNIKTSYNLKSEAKSYKIMLYPPCKNEDDSKFLEFEIPKTEISVVSRVIVTCGHRELYKLSASAAGTSGEGEILSVDGDSFSIPIGVSTGLDINFDNSTIVTVPDKKGYKSGKKERKFSNKRFVCIIDFNADEAVVSKFVGDEATKIAGDNPNILEKITETFGITKNDDDVQDLLDVLEEK
jgi:hypothetical protein